MAYSLSVGPEVARGADTTAAAAPGSFYRAPPIITRESSLAIRYGRRDYPFPGVGRGSPVELWMNTRPWSESSGR